MNHYVNTARTATFIKNFSNKYIAVYALTGTVLYKGETWLAYIKANHVIYAMKFGLIDDTSPQHRKQQPIPLQLCTWSGCQGNFLKQKLL